MTLKAEYFVTPEEYLAGEQMSQQKHEYFAGVVHAMSGSTLNHERIAECIRRQLGNQLEDSSCEVYSADVKVRVEKEKSEFYYYPDVTVDCGGGAGHSLFAEEPRVIFEILSASTEQVDRVEKLLNYQSLPSVEVYVLVDQFRVAVTVYRRAPDGWSMELLTKQEDVLELPTIGCRLNLAKVYARTGLI